MATTFNEFFFTNVAASLVSKLLKGPGIYNRDFLVNYYRNKSVVLCGFSLTNMTENKIHKLLCKLGSNKATCLAGLLAKFIKDSIDYITKPVTFIVDWSIKCGHCRAQNCSSSPSR